MLVITQILLHVKACLDQIPRLCLLPLQFPYRLCPSLQGTHETCHAVSYTFEANPKFSSSHWIWHIIIMTSAIISMLYQCIFEDTLLVEYAIHAFLSLAYTKDVLTVYMHHRHSIEFANFLNELLGFEKRWLNNNSETEQKYWKRVKYRNLIVLGLYWNRISVPILCVGDGLSAAIMPFSPFRQLPGIVLEKLFGIFPSVLTRLICFFYNYTVFYLCISEYMILAILSFFSAQFSMICMINAVKRLLINEDAYYPCNKTRKLDAIVRMYRETQLLCYFYNSIHKIAVNPPLILIGITGPAVALSMLVSFWEKVDLETGLVVVDLMVVCIGVLLLTFHFGVKLFIECKNFLVLKAYGKHYGKVHYSRGTRDKMAMRRYWRSFPLLKIFFLQSNFFESTTPLVMLNFSMSLAINLILLE